MLKIFSQAFHAWILPPNPPPSIIKFKWYFFYSDNNKLIMPDLAFHPHLYNHCKLNAYYRTSNVPGSEEEGDEG